MPQKDTKKMERILQREEETRQMSHLVGALAHEWKQPINILGLLIQDIRDAHEFGELNTEYLNAFVERGMKNIREISHSIDDFRNFFEPRFEAEQIDIKETLATLLGLFHHQYENHRIVTTIEGERFTVSGYLNTFRQGIMNILGVIKEAYDTKNKGKKRIIFHLDNEQKRLNISALQTGLDGAMLGKSIETEEPDIMELGSYASLYYARQFFKDGAGATLSVAAEEETVTFTVTF
jgi:nitrogen fixation/metabolism regulation signal transduction histidine kinase